VRPAAIRAALRHPVAQNATALYAVQFVLTVLPLITLPWLAHVLGPGELGVVVFVQSFSFTLGMVIEYGFQLSATRRIARRRGDREAMARTVAGVLGAKLRLIVAATGVALVALALVPRFREDPRLLAFGWAMAVLQGLNPAWFFTGLERLRLIAAVDVTIRLLTAAAIVGLVRHDDEGTRVLWIWTVGALSSVTVLTALLYREVPFRRPTAPASHGALREGGALFLGAAAVSLYTSATVFMLGLVVSSAQLAIFAAAERVVRAAVRATGPVSAAAFPRVNHLLEAGRPRRAQRLSATVLAAVVGLGLITAAALELLAAPLVHALFGSAFADSAAVLRVLALLLPAIAIGSTVSTLWLIPHRLDRLSTGVALACGGANVVLTPVVGAAAGPLGAAWVLVGIEVAGALALLRLIRARGLLPGRAEVLRP
jgi:polysaccharide transporter, PST family